MSAQPTVSIIVPTYNSADNIELFLGALRQSKFQDFEVIINDDARTNDSTAKIIESFDDLTIIYKQENTMMAQARKKGAEYATGRIIINLDSDMRVTPKLLDECVRKIDNGYDALIIPEESVGTTFWAQCKWLEKKMYEGIDEIESLRVVKTDIYRKLGGHDEHMVFSEDKDFDIRVRSAGYRVGRTANHLFHDEGELKLTRTLQKKLGYSHTANVFAEKHPEHYKWQANPFNRYGIYIHNVRYIIRHPLLYGGVWFMKTAEYTSSLLGLVIQRYGKNA